MGKKDKPGAGQAGEQKLKHSPFAALAKQSIAVAESPVVSETPAPPAAPVAAKSKSRGRLVLRRETKHRGGKAVIIVTGLELLQGFDEQAIAALAKQLKQVLGCGGTVEEEAGATRIVLQGDRPAKVAELLRAQGFRVDGVTS